MRKTFLLIIAMLCAISGWTQNLLYEDFYNSTYPPTGWTKMTGLASSAFAGTSPTNSSSGWTRVTTGFGISNAHPKINVYGTSCKYWLVTPTIDLGLGNPDYQLDFDLALTDYGNSNPIEATSTADDKFMVIISTDNGATWAQVNATIWDTLGTDFVYRDIPSTGQRITIPLGTYTGQIKIAFYGESTISGADNDIHIGNVHVGTPITCLPTTDLTTTAATTTSMDLSWTDSNNAGSWLITYRAYDDTIVYQEEAFSNPYTLLNLQPSTMYIVNVRAICSIGDTSVINERKLLSTECEPITIYPWTEDFEGTWYTSSGLYAASRPYCWINIDGGSSQTYNWRKTTASAYVHSGSGAAQMYGGSSATNTNSDWLISPKISLQGNEGLTFWAKGYNTINGTETYTSDLSIYIYDVTTNGDIDDFSDTSLFTQIMPNTIIPQVDWSSYDINLNQFYGEYRIAFVRNNRSAGYYTTIDDITFFELPSCIRPTSVAASNINSNDAEISWAPGNTGDASFYLYYKTSGDIDYDSVLVSNSPYNLTGLISDSIYNLYMRTNCGSQLSEATNPITFSTPCDPIATLPYVESFDNYGTGSSTFPDCWIKNTTYSTNPYCSSSYYSSSPASLYFYSTSETYNIGSTPKFDVSIPINTLRANFKLRKGTASNEITVGVMSDPSDFSTFDSITTISPSAINVWENFEVSFGLYQGNGKYIAFKCSYNTASNSMYLDDLIVSAIPNCARPTNINTTNNTTSSAEVSWDNGNTSDIAWWIYYKPNTASDWDSIHATTNPYTLNNLLSSSEYDLFIKTDCGSEISETSDTISFLTLCDAISTLPWTENFDTYGTASGTFIYCWARPIINSNYPSIVTANHSAPASIKFQSLTTNPTYVITPQFNYELSTLKVSFWLKAEGIGANQSGTISLGVMNSNSDTSTFELVQTIQPTSTDWTFYEISLSGISLSGLNNYIAFKHNSQASNWYYWLDDVNVDVRPTCPNTYSLEITSVTDNAVTINWSTLNSAGQGWEISYGESTGFDPSTGNIISVNDDPSNPPYTINGLSPETTYSFAVRQACGGEWSNIVTTNTMGLPATIPYTCDFEDESERNAWLLSNGTAENKWFIGSIVNSTPITGNSLYISKNNNGDSNIYNMSSTSTVVASRLIEFDGSNAYSLNFNSRIGGESSFDYLKVYLVNSDTNFVGEASTPYYGIKNYSNGVVLYNGTNPYFNNINNPTTVNNHTIELPYQGEVGTIKKLIFVWRNDSGSGVQPPACIDNISISTLSCSTPNVPTVSNITSNSVDIAWTDPNLNNSSWYIYYKPSTANDWDSIQETSSPITIQGLIPSTIYDVKIATDCGNEISSYTTSVSFTTSCLPITSLPWNEGFESITSVGEIPSCMAISGSTSYLSTYISTQSYNRSARTDSNYAAFKYSCWNRLFTPQFNLIAGTNYTFSFWYKADGSSGWNELSAGLYSSQDTASFVSTIGTPITSGITNTTYQQYTGTFSVASDGLYNIGIFCKATSSPWYLSIDDLSLTSEINTPCADPTSITVNNITNSTADVTWNAGGSETSWQVRLGTDGTPTDVNATSYQLTNLTAATDYVVYIRANCGSSYSSWVASTQFTTTNIITTPPTVVTDSVSAISQNQANLYGTITTGTETISAQGFAYKLASASTWISVAATGTNMTYSLTGLIANTAYEVKAFATTATDTYYGNIINFTTQNIIVIPPTVVTDSVSAISQNQANLYGTVTAGSENISAQGFEWKLASATTWTTQSASGTTITYPLIGLTANTTYEFRAFATTATATYYGNIETFTTLAIPVVLGEVTTQTATEIDTTHAVLHGTLVSVGNAIENIEVGFVYSTVTDPMLGETNVITVPVAYTEGMTTFSANIENLQPSTSYFFKAYVNNSAGPAYGAQETFITGNSNLEVIDGNQFLVNMYPNPANSTTNLVVSGVNGDTKIVISDVQGRIINTTIVKAVNGKVEKTIDVNDLAKGVYYVRIQNQNTSRTQKLIVK